jgi:hypothetical protein
MAPSKHHPAARPTSRPLRSRAGKSGGVAKSIDGLIYVTRDGIWALPGLEWVPENNYALGTSERAYSAGLLAVRMEILVEGVRHAC